VAIVVKNCPIFPCFAQKRKTLHSSQLCLAGKIVTHCEYKCYRPPEIGFGSLDATMDWSSATLARSYRGRLVDFAEVLNLRNGDDKFDQKRS
jgi:hypothetical protein